MSGHYSSQQAKQSLLHFFAGKGASALLGIAGLLLAVRSLAPADFGLMVAVLAFAEIFYLVSGFGLSTQAQRYVAEYRIKLTPSAFPGFIWRLQLRRLLYSVLFLMPVVLGARWLLAWFDMQPVYAVWPLFAVLLLLGTQVRFFDELFGSLLLQGAVQASLLLRNLLKLCGYGVFVLKAWSMPVATALWIEVVMYAAALLLSIWQMARYLRRTAGEPAGDGQLPHYRNPEQEGVSRRFYLVQCLGQVYGSNAQALLTTRLLGAVQTAALGFAQSLTDMVRNYLPAQLLLGWIRPLMVARYVEHRDYAQLQRFANIILKANLLAIIPACVLMFGHGDTIGAWLSGGRYPALGSLLAALFVLIALQTMHLVLGLVTLTIEKAGANIWATLLACAGLPLALLLAPQWGLMGIVVTLCISELIWIATVLLLLWRAAMPFVVEPGPVLRLLLAGGALALLDHWLSQPVGAVWWSLLACVLGGLLFLLLSWWLRPFNVAERAMLGKVLPARLRFS
ncbi:lipopolysaccharide biosynthesis protein [Jeongeupia chitinilytica]|uniref:Lipopolysaccharide biosynthesis protein n=1 Tax=Jeongeupia chitinilytica TaxID=1041641 RepID=A0ABQ3GVI1_9NEIS|nr:oligosaccharide flippase family protein [Jeongeupia chitinilytica]GHD56386.1 hypothetical protein GCM10007350_03380 [Jeongeupia chitinilytica]